jgi:hypothetical protein
LSILCPRTISLKRLTKTQILKNELKEVSKLNKVILAQNQELETQLADELILLFGMVIIMRVGEPPSFMVNLGLRTAI